MNKKIVAIIILLSSITGTVTVTAKNSNKAEDIVKTCNPKIEVMQGIAFDKSNNQTKQVFFLVMIYGNEESIYLIIGNESYKMIEAGNITEKERGTKIFFYRSEGDETLIIIIQKFNGKTIIAGEFKNYLIVFNCDCFCRYSKQVTQENLGLGKFQKETRKEIREQTRPVKGEWKSLIIKCKEVRNEEQKH
ncbi:MAG: hypothetical protein NZ942_01805 [Candidatus Aenigmarchaeota archaeon]|nr:hypothetical protein [Candidatus Aenigmarchaeota archaeon]